MKNIPKKKIAQVQLQPQAGYGVFVGSPNNRALTLRYATKETPGFWSSKPLLILQNSRSGQKQRSMLQSFGIKCQQLTCLLKVGFSNHIKPGKHVCPTKPARCPSGYGCTVAQLWLSCIPHRRPPAGVKRNMFCFQKRLFLVV